MTTIARYFSLEVCIAAATAKDGKKDGKPASGGAGGGYEVARPAGVCAVTQKPISPGDKFHAALRETATGMERVDVLPEAWASFPKEGLIASWLTTMPTHEQKKKVFVDDDTLCTIFERLADTEEPTKVRFRFVLGLILMRKRLVTYEGQKDGAGHPGSDSVWIVKLKGKTELLDLVNPHLNEEQVGDVAGQLGEILNSEL